MLSDAIEEDGEEATVDWTDADSVYGSKQLARKWYADGTASKVKAFLLPQTVFVPQTNGCKLFRNDGKGRFTDMTAPAGANVVPTMTCQTLMTVVKLGAA